MPHGEDLASFHDHPEDLPLRRPSRWRIVGRLLGLAVGAVALYGLAPQLIDVWSEVPELRTIRWWWFVVMVALMAGSLVCLWWLIRIALPGVSWFTAGTSQLASNAVSKAVPGGGAVGTALQYRMLSVSGVSAGSAATALAAVGLLSAWVLFGLPFFALVGSILGSPVPQGMIQVAIGGALVFVIMFAIGVVVVRADRPLAWVGRRVESVSQWVVGRLHRSGGLTADGLVEQRDLMVDALGSRWTSALGATVGNWLLDYLALVAALHAVGTRPRLSLVLLAFAVSAVLAMIPITPGGLGFVEAGLTTMLTLAGVAVSDALLAVLAYRIVSYWLPLPAGLVAYVAFRRRYGRPPTDTPQTRPDEEGPAEPAPTP